MDIKETISMLRIALTGGIGSGKTTAANIFAELGIPIVDADQISHAITQPNTLAFNEIVKHFGNEILNKGGSLNRRKLRDIVFKDNSEKKWLEAILHPIIIDKMKDQLSKINAPYVILAIPLLAEYGVIEFVDRVLVIDAPLEKQIERVCGRDKTSANDLEAIINSQSSREKRLSIADDVIVNDSDLINLRKQIALLHGKYLDIAKQGTDGTSY